MTIEELEIIVSASIEPALKEIKKLMPSIKQQVTQAVEVAEKSMQQIDMKQINNKIQKAVQSMKNKINKINKDNQIAITVNNKDAQKQISQIEKQIDSLQKKINARQLKLDAINPQIDAIVDNTRREVVPDGISLNDSSMDKTVNNALASNKDFTTLNAQAQKLYTEIEMYNKELDEAKSKMSELKQETNNTATTQNKLSSFFSTFKTKLEQSKNSVSRLKDNFNQIPKITQNITNNVKKMSVGIKNSLSHILKYAGALFSLRGIYSVLSNSAQSWLSSQNAGAQQLSANIEYMKYAMGSVFAPVIEYVINLIYQLMKAIQSVIYAFSGINIFAKATASSMNKTASSASKASKSLAGVHNEINNVSENDSSGSGGTTTPSFDLSQMDNTSNSIIDAIKNGDWYLVGETIGQKLNEAMDSIEWDKIQEGAKKVGTNIAEFINGFIEETDWYEVGKTISEGINTAVDFASAFIEETDWGNLGNAIGTTIGSTIMNIDWNNIGRLIVSSMGSLKEFFTEIGRGIVDGILEGIAEKTNKSTLWQLLKQLIVDPFVNGIKEKFGIHSPSTVMRDEVGVNIIEGIFQGISSSVGKITGIWNNMKSTAIEVFSNLKTNIVNKVNEIKDGIKNKFQEAYNGIKNIFSNIGSFFSGVWNNVKNTFSALGTKIGDAISGAVKSGINGVISLIERTINSAIRLINGGIKLINLIPGVSVGTINTLSLPRLAKGGVLTEATAVIAGEYSGAKSNPEIVTPQNIMEETFDRVMSRYEGNNNDKPINLAVYVGNTKLGQILLDDLRNMKRRSGKDIEALVGG